MPNDQIQNTPSPEQIVPPPPPEQKVPLTKRKFFIPSLLGIVLFLILGSYILSQISKRSQEAARVPTPTPTPFQTYTGLRSTPQPVFATYTLERKVGIYTDKILTFSPTEYYKDDHQLTRFKDYLYYVDELPVEKDPHPKKLMQLNITTGEKKVLYDSKLFQEKARQKFPTEPYYYFIPFHIIDNTLFFSILTEGYNGSNPGPSQAFALDLNNVGEPQKIADFGGYVYHSKGHYWLNTYAAPCSECLANRSYNLLDPQSKAITSLAIDGKVISITNDELLYVTSKSNGYPPIPPAVKRISLSNPQDVQEVIPPATMPADITDVSSISNDQLLLVGLEAFYRFKRQTSELEKLVEVNDWTGDKLNSTLLQGPFHIAHLNEKEAYIPIGSTSGKTPLCYRYSFADKTFKRITYAEAKCMENMKAYNNNLEDLHLPPDDTGPAYKTLEEKIKSLKLPKEYIFKGM